jgi:hypothetical protein
MLLRKLVPERQLDFAPARFDPGQHGADMRLDALARKAVADALGEIGIGGLQGRISRVGLSASKAGNSGTSHYPEHDPSDRRTHLRR